MPTVTLPTQRRHHFKDKDGVISYAKDEDSVEEYSIDWTNELNSGATVSTSTWAADGVTVDSSSLATPIATAVISKTDGTVKNTITTSDSRTYIKRLRFVGSEV